MPATLPPTGRGTGAPVTVNGAAKQSVRSERRAPYDAGHPPGQSPPPARPPGAVAPPLQERWLAEHLGARVAVRLSDGKTLHGVLRAYDSYCLTLAVDGDAGALLIYKSHVAYIRPGGRSTD